MSGVSALNTLLLCGYSIPRWFAYLLVLSVGIGLFLSIPNFIRLFYNYIKGISNE